MRMKKRICIIRSNPVRPDSRVEKEAAALHEAGFQVQILSWDRDSNHEEEQDFVVDGTIPITRLGYKASFGEGFKNLKSYLKFQFHMCKWLVTNADEYDIIHACDFDTAFFSRMAAVCVKKKFVFDVFDFLYGNPRGLLQKAVYAAQVHLINSADATIICTEERKQQIAKATPKKLVVIHNTPPKIQDTETSHSSGDGKVSVVYVGVLQDLRLLQEMTNVFIRNKDLQFNVGGFGKLEDFFTKAAEENDNIDFLGRLAYKDTIELEKRSDIMLAVYDPSIENHVFAAPNKFYESLMLGKPVIMVKGTGMSQEVEKNQIGVVIEYSEEGFETGLRELIARKDEWPEMAARMKDLYDRKYNWAVMKERLVQLYDEM